MAGRNEIAHRCLLRGRGEPVPGWYLLELEAPRLTRAVPGQFVHLRPGRGTDPLLRRPISIHCADVERGRIQLLIRPAGRGTAGIPSLRVGEELDLLGPLGRGFPHLEEGAPAILVAGGIGLAPLLFAAVQRRRAGLPFELLLGGTSGAFLPPDEYFRAHGVEPAVATDDGSRGRYGPVTALLEQRLGRARRPLRVHACGPMPMLARVVELTRAAGVAAHLSLESRMACGVGACLGCVLPFRVGGKLEYRRVCREGPVFDGEEVYFEC